MRIDNIWEGRNRTPILLAGAVLLLIIALMDWWTKPFVSLGFLYLFPIMLAAGFLPRWSVVLLGLLCAILAELFSSLEPSLTRLALEALALTGCGLFVAELVRNRRMTIESQSQLRVLVETSPAAIVTIDGRGFIELANEAASRILAPRAGELIGVPIAAFLPELDHALRWEERPQFRASMQCQGHRGNGDAFTAEVWFSTYRESARPKLAAIIADVTDDTASAGPFGASFAGAETASETIDERIALNAREQEVLRLLVQGLTNKEIAARMKISESAVKNSFQQLFRKTGVRTRSQLVREALERHRSLL